jgi:hypothetical protein
MDHFIDGLPIKNCGSFHSYVHLPDVKLLVYQRVIPFKMVIFKSYVSLPEGNDSTTLGLPAK